MKKSMSLKFVILIHVNLYLLSQCTADLSKTCQQTPNPSLCITTLKVDPQSATADVSGLAKIGANILQKKASTTKDQINGLIANNRDKKLVEALKCSAASYDMIVNVDIPEVIEAVTKGNPKFGQDGANDIASEADDCQKCFSRVSPIDTQNKFVHDFALVLSAIIQQLL